MHKKTLLENIDKIHTTEMGVGRIQKNLGIDEEPVGYCISKLEKDNSKVTREGKNYYVEVDGCRITINSSSFTIITAHRSWNLPLNCLRIRVINIATHIMTIPTRHAWLTIFPDFRIYPPPWFCCLTPTRFRSGDICRTYDTSEFFGHTAKLSFLTRWISHY